MIVQRQFEVAVGLEGDEPFGTPLAQIKRLIKPDILEIAGRQDGKKTVAIMRIAPGGSQNLTAQRHGVGNIEVAEVEVVLCEADAIAPRRAQRPAFAQGLAQIVKIERFFGIHCRYSLEF